MAVPVREAPQSSGARRRDEGPATHPNRRLLVAESDRSGVSERVADRRAANVTYRRKGALPFVNRPAGQAGLVELLGPARCPLPVDQPGSAYWAKASDGAHRL